MRDIKFRGLRTDGQGWVYGYYGIKGFDTDIERHCIMQSTLNSGSVDSFYFTDIDVLPESVGQFTGLLHKGKTEVYQDDIFYDEIEHDHGDERLFYVITWINERASFAFLTAQERKDYDECGLSAIERDFEGFYYELDQDSLDKMHSKSKIHENPELL